LQQNYPNPFNPTTTIPFDLARSGETVLIIFDNLGREIARPLSGSLNAGRHQVVWDASGQPAGVYFARLATGGSMVTKKMLLVK
jgi:hypothetical protein